MRPTYDKKMNQQVIEAIYDGRFLDFLQERGIEFSKQELIVIISELYKAYDTTASMVIDKNNLHDYDVGMFFKYLFIRDICVKSDKMSTYFKLLVKVIVLALILKSSVLSVFFPHTLHVLLLG